MYITNMYYIIKHRGIQNAWNKISPYHNYKLLINKGIVTRNMKKIGESLAYKSKLIEKDLKMGLLSTENGAHAVAYDKYSRSGVTITSKKQQDLLLVTDEQGSKSYAQLFFENQMLPFEKVTNSKLSEVLSNRAIPDVCKAHILISDNKDKYIRVNNANKQEYIKIGDKHIAKANDFMHKLGNKTGTQEFLHDSEVFTIFLKSKEEAFDMILALSNGTITQNKGYFLQKKNILYKNMQFLKNHDKLSANDKQELDIWFQKIESFF